MHVYIMKLLLELVHRYYKVLIKNRQDDESHLTSHRLCQCPGLPWGRQGVCPTVTHYPLQTYANAQDCPRISAFQDVSANSENCKVS